MNTKILNTKILIAATVGLSLFAAAQSETDKSKTKPSSTQTQNPRDLATGQSTGRIEPKALVHRDLATRDAASGQATGKKSAQDDWHQSNAVSTGASAGVKPVSSSSGTNAQPRVATGDVNGDGTPDAAASRSSAHATESTVQSPRDVATGQASGKRQHQPVRVIKEVDAASPHVATGDVNGDGAPDAAASKGSAHATESKVQSPRDVATGQMSGKRQHQPVTITKETDKTPK